MRSLMGQTGSWLCWSGRVLRPWTMAIAFLAGASAHAEVRCQEINSMRSPVYDGAQSFGFLTRCHDPRTVASREFYVLRTEGPFATHQYLHGALLSEVIDRALGSKNADDVRWVSGNDQSIRDILTLAIRCAEEQIREHAPVEWRRAYQLFNFGYSQSKAQVAFDPVNGLSEFESWQMAPEVFRALEHYFGSMSEGTYANSSLAYCVGALDTGKRARLREMFGRLERAKYRISTDAVVTPAHPTLKSPVYHGASFSVGAEADPRDSTLLISIVNEGKDYFRYLGLSRVGDSGPASLGGWNEKGLSVTLHRAPMESGDFGGFRAERAPGVFIAHQILRSAATIDQAFAIASRILPYNSWTLTVASQDTAETATIEISPKNAVISRRSQARYFVQTEQLFSSLVLQGARYESYDELASSRARQVRLERDARAIFQTGAAFKIQDFAGFFDPFRPRSNSGSPITPITGRLGQFAQVVMAPEIGRVWINTDHALGGPASNYSELRVDLKSGVVEVGGTVVADAPENLARSRARRFAAQAALESAREARISLLERARAVLTMAGEPDEFSLDYALARLLVERDAPGDINQAISLLQGNWSDETIQGIGDGLRRANWANRTLYLIDPARFAALKPQLIRDFRGWGENPNSGAVQSEVEAWIKKIETASSLPISERFTPFDFGQVE